MSNSHCEIQIAIAPFNRVVYTLFLHRPGEIKHFEICVLLKIFKHFYLYLMPNAFTTIEHVDPGKDVHSGRPQLWHFAA